MTESCDSLFAVSREARDRLECYARLVAVENDRQNLVSSSTLPAFWHRHIDDSLQLLGLIQGHEIADIGSGAGLPGIVLACASDLHVTLIEPRRRRSEFLQRIVAELGLSSRVRVEPIRVERVRRSPLHTIVARAVAALPALFAAAAHLADDSTRWVLPKGRSAAAELEEAEKSWQGDFALMASATDRAASIVVADRVRRRTA